MSAITDGQARRIAADWHGGQASAVYALACSGAIAREECLRELRHADGPEVPALVQYIEAHGDRGPVAGWSQLAWDMTPAVPMGQLPIWRLAELAGCPVPTGAGIAVLESVRDAIAEDAANFPEELTGDPQAYAAWTADAAVSPYTHTAWESVVDLCAFDELQDADTAYFCAALIGQGKGYDIPSQLIAPIAERLAVALMAMVGTE